MKFRTCVSLAALAALGQPSLAQPPAASTVHGDIALAPAPEQPASPEAAPLAEQPAPESDGALDLDQLAGYRGGETIAVQLTNQNLNAVNAGNTINGNTVDSGAINLNANAFNGFDGIGNFVVNTGHNNNLMGSVSVNVMVVPQ